MVVERGRGTDIGREGRTGDIYTGQNMGRGFYFIILFIFGQELSLLGSDNPRVPSHSDNEAGPRNVLRRATLQKWKLRPLRPRPCSPSRLRCVAWGSPQIYSVSSSIWGRSNHACTSIDRVPHVFSASCATRVRAASGNAVDLNPVRLVSACDFA